MPQDKAMLRINLLPRYVRDKRLVPLYAAVCGVILIVLALTLGSYVITIGAQVSRLNGKVQELAQQAEQVKALESQIATAQSDADAAKKRIEFIQQVQNTGPAWADYIEKLSKWVPANAYLDSWTIADGKLQWNGRLQPLDPSRGLTSGEYMRFYINLLGCPMLSGATLKMEGLGEGYSYWSGTSSSPSAGQEFIPYTVTAELVSPPSMPVFQAAAAAAAPAGPAQPGAGPPGAAAGPPGAKGGPPGGKGMKASSTPSAEAVEGEEAEGPSEEEIAAGKKKGKGKGEEE